MKTNAQKSDFGISLIRDDLIFRVQQHLGLIPQNGLGIIRRAVFYALLAWLPVAIWAMTAGRAFPGTISEPLLQHFGIHVRFLVAVPIMIIGESLAHKLTIRLIPHFLGSGLVPEEHREDFRNILLSVIRLRNSTVPWVVILTVIVSWLIIEPPHNQIHELIWANVGQPAHFDLGFGGWWLIYIARPIFAVFLFAWLWRLILFFILLKRIARLPLSIVPTHPDRAGGLGFLEKLPSAFSLYAFALSAVFSSRLAHEVVYHGVHVQSLKIISGVFLIVVLLLCLSPLMVFVPTLATAKRRALLEYGALVGNHGRQVRRRWILQETIDDPLLDAPEVGPVADTLALYEAVTRMRPVPIGKSAILAIAIPTAIPILALFSIEIPVKDILIRIVSTLL